MEQIKQMIDFEEFSKVDIRMGTILEVNDFPKARKPAYQLTIDFGELGIKKSSAQITTLYSKEELVGKQISAIVNFKPMQIANFKSECLVLGIQNGNDVVLLSSLNNHFYSTFYKVKKSLKKEVRNQKLYDLKSLNIFSPKWFCKFRPGTKGFQRFMVFFYLN